jgi:hypothetical protein
MIYFHRWCLPGQAVDHCLHPRNLVHTSRSSLRSTSLMDPCNLHQRLKNLFVYYSHLGNCSLYPRLNNISSESGIFQVTEFLHLKNICILIIVLQYCPVQGQIIQFWEPLLVDSSDYWTGLWSLMASLKSGVTR